MRINVLALGALSLALLGCDSGPTPAKPAKPTPAKPDVPVVPEVVADEGPSGPITSAGACAAESAWLTSTSFPAEVPDEGATQCDFEQYAWQSLLYLVQPSASTEGELEFETWMPNYGIFVAKEDSPIAWGTPPPNPCGPPGARLYSDIIKQAGVEQPLIAPDGQFVYYALSVNEPAYDMLTECELYRSNCAGPLSPGNPGIDIIGKYPALAFPDQAVELKTSWKVLTEAERDSKLFYTTEGWIQPKADAPGSCKKVDLGLLGIHIVAKPPSTPSFVWATFEHRNNAPNCSDLKAKPPLGDSWTLFDESTCGEDCTTNTYEPGQPAQVCRMHPEGDSLVGTFPDGKNCEVVGNQYICQAETKAMLEQSSTAIRELNGNVQALIADSPKLIDPVWANYELVGNVWTKDNVLPPQLQSQVGALSAANTSMETFVQNGVAAVTNPNNCFSCHNQDSGQFGKNLPPAGLSHIYDHIAKDSGGCADGSLPTACAKYYTK